MQIGSRSGLCRSLLAKGRPCGQPSSRWKVLDEGVDRYHRIIDRLQSSLADLGQEFERVRAVRRYLSRPEAPAADCAWIDWRTRAGTVKCSSSATTRIRNEHRIAELARTNRGVALSSLHHVIDLEWLKEAYRLTRKDGAPGIDGVMANQYAANLEAWRFPPLAVRLLHPFLTSSKLGPQRKEGYLASRRFTRQAGGQRPHQVQAASAQRVASAMDGHVTS